MEKFCYIHIPFCSSKCSYCRFASIGSSQSLQIDLYCKKLLQEIEKHNDKDTSLKSIYFGGGTPSVLSINQLNDIFIALKNKYIFSSDIEITLETTPININIYNLLGWKEIGINRISIGVQTLNNDSLKEISRGEKGDILKALELISDLGFENVSVDFIIGLPYVKKGETQSDIDFLLNKYDFIKHISVYMLEDYYNEGLINDSKYEKISYPSDWGKLGLIEEDYLEEYIGIKKYLKEKGFNSYEISNFSKKGFECKHNKSYWNHSEVIAFGLGASGYENNIRYKNSEDFIKYYSQEDISSEKLTKQDIFYEKVMFGLRTRGLDDELIKNLNKGKIGYFLENGYLISTPGLKLTDKGVLVLDYIVLELLS